MSYQLSLFLGLYGGNSGGLPIVKNRKCAVLEMCTFANVHFWKCALWKRILCWRVCTNGHFFIFIAFGDKNSGSRHRYNLSRHSFGVCLYKVQFSELLLGKVLELCLDHIRQQNARFPFHNTHSSCRALRKARQSKKSEKSKMFDIFEKNLDVWGGSENLGRLSNRSNLWFRNCQKPRFGTFWQRNLASATTRE